MNTTSSDNFYLLLELFLDPPEENWATVEARINEKKNEWNKKRNNPDGLIYQRLSERVEEMRTALSDADRRKSEGKAARTAALRWLDEQIALRAGETIAPEQVDALVKEFKNFFTEKTIRSRVKVPICDAAPTRRVPDPPKKPQDDPTIPRFDPSKLREVKNCLTTLGKKTIYEALEVAGTSSPSRLQEAADEAVKKAKKKVNKTAEISALGVLGGLAKEFFKDAKSKKGFEASWANFQFEEKLKSVFNGRIVSKNENGKVVKFVTEENYERSLREATEEGMAPDVAEWFVYDFYVNKRKCPDPRTSDVGQALSEKVNCPNCFRQNDKSASRCVACGYALQTKCPKCGVASVLSEFCPKCGFSFGDMANSELALQNAKEALGRGDFDTASQEWGKAKVYWAENPDLQGVATQLRDVFARRQYEKFETELAAGRVDEALKLRQNFSFDGGTSPLVEELNRRAEERLDEETSRRRDDYARKQFENFERELDAGRLDEALKLRRNFALDGINTSLVEELNLRAEKRLDAERDFLELLQNVAELQRKNRYFEAEAALAGLPRELALRSKVVEKKEEIARVLQQLHDELDAASRLSDSTLKEMKINELIERYPGFQQAQDALEALPPVAPSGVQAQTSDEGIALAWNQRSTRGVSYYRIARFLADADASDEGTVVCERCEEREFLDATADEFQRYYYEVVSVNLKDCESYAAQSAEVVRGGKARDIEVEAVSREVKVRWKVSPNVEEIKVYRKNLTNPSEESVRVEPVGIDGFSDAGLENGAEYEYATTLRYRDANGEQTTTPQHIRATPCEEVGDLKYEWVNDELSLSWIESSESDALFWIFPKRSGLAPGTTMRGSLQDVATRFGARPVELSNKTAPDENGRVAATIKMERGSTKAFLLPATRNKPTFEISTEEFFALGKEETLLPLNPPKNFFAQHVGRRVYFTWDWPEGAEEAVIWESEKEPPSEANYSSCKSYTLSKTEYEQEGAWNRNFPAGWPVFFKLFMVYNNDGEKRRSRGVDFRNRRVAVEYEKIERVVKEARSLKKTLGTLGKILTLILTLGRSGAKKTSPAPRVQTFLRFQADSTNGTYYIPEICVVRQWGRAPFRRDDGEVVLTIPESRERVLEFCVDDYREDADKSDKPPYYRCYFKNREDTLNFALFDPPNTQLKWPTKPDSQTDVGKADSPKKRRGRFFGKLTSRGDGETNFKRK